MLVLLALVYLFIRCCVCCFGRKKSPKRNRKSHPRSPKDAAAAAAFLEQLRSEIQLTQRKVATARFVLDDFYRPKSPPEFSELVAVLGCIHH